MKLYKAVLFIQGIYTALTALWALVDIESFMDVTGPKNDIWLVKTLSVVLLAVGFTFLVHTNDQSISSGAIILGLTTSLGLALIDFYYSSENIISNIYAVDGIFQIAFFILWIFIGASQKNT